MWTIDEVVTIPQDRNEKHTPHEGPASQQRRLGYHSTFHANGFAPLHVATRQSSWEHTTAQ